MMLEQEFVSLWASGSSTNKTNFNWVWGKQVPLLYNSPHICVFLSAGTLHIAANSLIQW